MQASPGASESSESSEPDWPSLSEEESSVKLQQWLMASSSMLLSISCRADSKLMELCALSKGPGALRADGA